MKRIAVFCGLLLITCSFVARADLNQYWVAGTFQSLAGAANEKRRVEGLSNLPVQIGTFNLSGRTSYRLLVKKNSSPRSQSEILEDAGVSPWTLTLESSSIDFADANVSGSSDYMDSPSVAVARMSQSGSGSGEYLVLAGFRSVEHAHNFHDQVASNDVADVVIEEIDLGGRPYFRVMHGPFDVRANGVRERFIAMGMSDAWWTTKAAKAVKEVMIARVEPVMEMAMPEEEPPVEEPMMEPEPIIQIRPPRPGESYFDYCIKRANSEERARYCGNGRFMSVAVKEEQARQGLLTEDQYMEFCTEAAGASQRETLCTDRKIAETLSRLDEFQ